MMTDFSFLGEQFFWEIMNLYLDHWMPSRKCFYSPSASFSLVVSTVMGLGLDINL